MQIAERNAYESGKDYALRLIKDNIIRLVLEPGCTLSVNELAMQMGLSRTPVREAIGELSKTGIVEVVPQSGSRVSLVDYKLVDESRFLRNTMECAVVRLVCEQRSPEQLLRIKENIRMQELYLENNLPERFLELDDAFHKLLFEFTDKMEIYELVRNFSVHFDRLRNMAVVAVKDLKSIEDHRMIADAIEAQDGELAAQLMDAHLSRYKVEVDEVKARYSNYFK